MDFTGERFIPGIENYDNSPMAFEHWHRYIIASKFVKNKVVLDIACGEGYGTNHMAESEALQVYGVDISNEAIEHASKKYIRDNLSFQCGSVEKLDFEDNSIDVIVSFETIEHVDEKMQEAFLKEANRVLKKEGILILSCPNKKVATDYAWETWQYKNEFHMKEYYIDEFDNFLRKHFTNVELSFQRYEITLLLSSKKTSGLEVIMNNDSNFEHAQNIIAICSNSTIELPKLDSIVLERQGTYLETMAIIANAEKHGKSLEKYNRELKDQITSLENENVSLQNQQNNFKNQLSGLQSHNSNMQNQITSLQSHNSNIQNQVLSLQNHNLNLQNTILNLQSENLKMQDQITILQLEIACKQNEASDLEIKNSDLLNQIHVLHVSKEELLNQNVTLQALANELHRIHSTRSWKILNLIHNFKRKLFNQK
ncbi:methyltransferase domain-containing protein [Paenibacillus elgii]